MFSYSKWLAFLVCIVMMISAYAQVPITIVQDAVTKGAVCLDGSPPAYHFDKGFGTGIGNWLVHLQGGGWCNTPAACLDRTRTDLGSSNLMTKTYTFTGILSNDPEFNPEFYNWNRILVRYCDGSSYTGDVEAVDPNARVFYRGARVWRAVMDDLLAKGMMNAQNAILSGCSAGALGAILQCDNFRSLISPGAKVKCISDAGFFMDIQDISRAPLIQGLFAQLIETHGSAENLPKSCTSKYHPYLCIFPQFAAQGIRTPLFLLNAAYDTTQINLFLAPAKAQGTWRDCRANIAQCSEIQLQTLEGLRKKFLLALKFSGNSPSRGLFINSCYTHCQSESQATWQGDDSPKVDNTTISKAVGDWFYDRKISRRIDCPYPCDKTCPHY